MTQDPMTDVANFLASAGLGLTLGTNLFKGEEAAESEHVPHSAVFVMAEGGDGPLPYLGSGDDCSVEVEVTVRGAPKAFDAPRLLARSIRDALHRATVSGYYSVLAEDTEPEHLGRTDSGCHEWAVAFTLSWTA